MNKREGVRATLTVLPGVLDVLIDGRVVFQMKPGARLDVEQAKELLKDQEIEVKGDSAIDGFRFSS